jgi:tetratricopeptide (TPR) repeat protein
VAERYLAARDLVASRKAQPLEQAIHLLNSVTLSAPGYAPGYAALAEANILSREFGVRADSDAFPKALFATRAALRLDPDLADAHRMEGFIDYWWEQDIEAATRAFETAVDLSPRDATLHFWFGNILVDSGDFAAGLDHLNTARSLQPGSIPILTDLAWAQWSQNCHSAGSASLDAIARDHPDYAGVFEYLAIIRLAEGDYAGHAAALSRFAVLRENAVVCFHADDVDAAAREGGSAAYAVVLRNAMRDFADNPRRTLAWTTFVATIGSDRDMVLSLLSVATRKKEPWGEAGIVGRIRQHWAGDPHISAMLAILA